MATGLQLSALRREGMFYVSYIDDVNWDNTCTLLQTPSEEKAREFIRENLKDGMFFYDDIGGNECSQL